MDSGCRIGSGWRFRAVIPTPSTEPAPDLNLTGDWTLEGWFKENRAGGQDESQTTVRELVSKGPLGTAEVPYFLVFGENTLRAGLRRRGRTFRVTYRMPHARGTQTAWHHVAATYDGNSMKIYIDGVLRAQQAAGGSL